MILLKLLANSCTFGLQVYISIEMPGTPRNHNVFGDSALQNCTVPGLTKTLQTWTLWNSNTQLIIHYKTIYRSGCHKKTDRMPNTSCSGLQRAYAQTHILRLCHECCPPLNKVRLQPPFYRRVTAYGFYDLELCLT